MGAALETPPEREKSKALDSIVRLAGGINIGHLMLIIFALHLFALSFPSDTSNGAGKVFDESYYVPASLDILHWVPSNVEHPFFGKIWGALGIVIFGDNFFGWRILYAVIGTLSVFLMYELARHFFSKEKALLAASMLAFENVFFIHTSLLLLDGPPILFALAGFLGYFKKRYYLSALAFGLCILSKETGAFFLIALVIYHLWTNAKNKPLGRPEQWRKALAFLIIVSVVVGLPLWGYDVAYHPYETTTAVVQVVVSSNPLTNVTTTTTTTTTEGSNYVTNPFQNFAFYFSYQSSLVGCGKIDQWNCYPWEWILPFNIDPLPYYISTVTVTSTVGNGGAVHVISYHPIDWQGMGNLVVWFSIWLVVPTVAWKLVRRKAGQADMLSLCLIAATYLPLFYISLVSHRVEYAFYFMNTDVGLALGVPLVVTFAARGRVRAERLLILLWVVAAVVFFMMYFPVNPFAFMS
ncbi:MAG: glycosyltransferase family 39 protein [Thaumarchaeota archaeon]|nr:glycosyltransferase family 39 protein [Nitrososphaerota archaeon]